VFSAPIRSTKKGNVLEIRGRHMSHETEQHTIENEKGAFVWEDGAIAMEAIDFGAKGTKLKDTQ
jgi:hypothetical protein